MKPNHLGCPLVAGCIIDHKPRLLYVSSRLYVFSCKFVFNYLHQGCFCLRLYVSRIKQNLLNQEGWGMRIGFRGWSQNFLQQKPQQASKLEYYFILMLHSLRRPGSTHLIIMFDSLFGISVSTPGSCFILKGPLQLLQRLNMQLEQFVLASFIVAVFGLDNRGIVFCRSLIPARCSGWSGVNTFSISVTYQIRFPLMQMDVRVEVRRSGGGRLRLPITSQTWTTPSWRSADERPVRTQCFQWLKYAEGWFIVGYRTRWRLDESLHSFQSCCEFQRDTTVVRSKFKVTRPRSLLLGTQSSSNWPDQSWCGFQIAQLVLVSCREIVNTPLQILRPLALLFSLSYKLYKTGNRETGL